MELTTAKPQEQKAAVVEQEETQWIAQYHDMDNASLDKALKSLETEMNMHAEKL